MGQYRELLQLAEDQRNELSLWAQSRTLAAGDVFRARLILALADGWSCSQMIEKLQTSAPTISHWKQRFEQDGIAGLDAPSAGFGCAGEGAHCPQDAAAARRRHHATCRTRSPRMADGDR